MSNKVKDVDIKNRRYHSFNDITNIKSFDVKNIKCEVMQKYYCLLHSICNDQRFEIRKN